MELRVVHLTSTPAGGRGRPAHAAAPASAVRSSLQVARIDEPETIMAISFEGLTEREQEAALAAFPGGRRFVLAN
ncbi:hypothetical protein [Devosia sp.]|uniref:hypothetical protein n=1 Tax=Devosia sp. TaxID=1871048 RepID=UPI001AC821F7|nr:hypothetical protein [Devosia sp.]MBN9311145.1 hypothetical protein [Devosia sp.]